MLGIIHRVVLRYSTLNSDKLVVYHGTSISHGPILRPGSYTTTEFFIAASYGRDKDRDHFWVHEYVVEDPFELIVERWGSELKMTPRYNHDMGHDAYLNHLPISPSGKKWEFVKVDNAHEGVLHWGSYYKITPRPPA